LMVLQIALFCYQIFHLIPLDIRCLVNY